MYWSANEFPLQEELKQFEPWTLEDGEAIVLAGGQIRACSCRPRGTSSCCCASSWGTTRRAASRRRPSTRSASTTRADSSTSRRCPSTASWKRRGRNPTGRGTRSTQIEKIRRPQVHAEPDGRPAREPARRASRSCYRNVSEGPLRRAPDRPRGVPPGRCATSRSTCTRGRRTSGRCRTGPTGSRSRKNQELLSRTASPAATWARRSRAGRTSSRTTARTATPRPSLQTPLDAGGAYLVQAYLGGAGRGRREGARRPHPAGRQPGRGGPDRPGGRREDGQGRQAPLRGRRADRRARAGRDGRRGGVLVGVEAEGAEELPLPRPVVVHGRTPRAWPCDPSKKRSNRGQMHVLVKAGEGEDARLAWGGMHYWQTLLARRPCSRARTRTASPTGPCTDPRSRSATRSGFATGAAVCCSKGTRQILHGDGLRSARQHGPHGEPPGGRLRRARRLLHAGRGADARRLPAARVGCELAGRPELPRRGVQEAGVRGHGRAERDAREARRDAQGEDPGDVLLRRAGHRRGRSQYKVFREEYRHRAYPPGVWDWLYGPGYGLCWYDYDWFPWWRWVLLLPRGAGLVVGLLRLRIRRVAGRHARARAGPAGRGARSARTARVEVEIDTSAALRDHPDLDHRYVIQAEVRDASRRVITGEGAVKVTRQAYYATGRARPRLDAARRGDGGPRPLHDAGRSARAGRRRGHGLRGRATAAAATP